MCWIGSVKSFHLNILILWKISVGADNLLISKAFSTPFFIEHTKHVRFFFSAYTTFYSQEGALSMGVLYMADFTSRFYKAKGRQARPQMDSV